MLNDVAGATPLCIRLTLVHLIGDVVEGIHTARKQVLVSIEEQGVAKKFVYLYQAFRKRHCH
jgi:hypothetical protein